MSRSAAFQGRGWRPREASLRDELSGKLWARWRVDSEYKRLEAVVLGRPGGIDGIRNPNAVQHLAPMNAAALGRELRRIAATFRRLGVKVFSLPDDFGGWPAKHNLMFVRDLFFNTPEGAVVSRMASAVRAGEEKHAALLLARLGVPIVRTVSGRGLLESADALWLDPRTVVCGVGNRTNAEGFRQLRETLRSQGVEAVSVPLPRGVQHLLGLLQIVDRRLAFLRTRLAPRSLRALLKGRRFSVVPVEETGEVVRRQGLNVVTVAPRRIVMPAGCPDLKRRYQAAGVAVAAESEVSQLLRGAGGLACAVGVLSRRA